MPFQYAPLEACPVKRVNADSLHQVVLEEIRRGADHPTRTAELIREAVKQVPTAEKSDDQLTAIARRLRDTDKKIKNLMSVMEAGGAGVRSLISRLQELEEERARLLEEQPRLEAEKAETRLDRPDAAQVQALWGRFLRLWEAATDEEKTKLMPLLVERVVMTEKERGICELLFSADTAPPWNASTSSNVLINSTNRADRFVVVNYPPIQFPDFEVSRISTQSLETPGTGRRRSSARMTDAKTP